MARSFLRKQEDKKAKCSTFKQSTKGSDCFSHFPFSFFPRRAFTLAEVLIAKRESGKMSLLNISQTRELKAPSRKLFKQCAFTLAEVLITLGIIGVVAAMTVPTLMNSTQEKELRTAWKKEYSAISQAYNLVKNDEGGDLSGYFTTNNSSLPLLDKMADYMSVRKSCNAPYASDNGTICDTSFDTGNFYKTQSGSWLDAYNLKTNQYILQDGAHLFSRGWTGLNLWIDVNGPNKKPNVLGKDMFGMYITKDKVIPFGASGSGVDTSSCSNAPLSSPRPSASAGGGDYAGAGCAAKYLYE